MEVAKVVVARVGVERAPDMPATVEMGAVAKVVEATQAAVRQQVAVAGMQVLQRGAAAAAMAEVVLVTAMERWAEGEVEVEKLVEEIVVTESVVATKEAASEAASCTPHGI